MFSLDFPFFLIFVFRLWFYYSALSIQAATLEVGVHACVSPRLWKVPEFVCKPYRPSLKTSGHASATVLSARPPHNWSVGIVQIRMGKWVFLHWVPRQDWMLISVADEINLWLRTALVRPPSGLLKLRLCTLSSLSAITHCFSSLFWNSGDRHDREPRQSKWISYELNF